MKRGSVFSLLFTVVLCVACAGILTSANRLWFARIEANEAFSRVRAIVGALGLVAYEEKDRGVVADRYDRTVALKREGELDVFEGRRGESVVGFALDVAGHGKHGPIRGVLSVCPERSTIRDMTVYECSETPGLGGRIVSREWLDQFKRVPLVTDGMVGVIISGQAKGPNAIDAITGASKTMRAVERMVNTIIARFLSGGIKLVPLGIVLDEITGPTPNHLKPTVVYPPCQTKSSIPRAEPLVPPGVTNLARGRPVVPPSDEEPIIGEWRQLTDGCKTSDDWECVEPMPDQAWVQIDLGQTRAVYGVAAWHMHKNPRGRNKVVVQVSDDPLFAEYPSVPFGDEPEPASGEAWPARSHAGRAVGQRGRYVRVWSWEGAVREPVRIVEVEVYGR
jgi:Na+-translocating ferredoxin:NAD+ oxidoreductase RnfG subunit